MKPAASPQAERQHLAAHSWRGEDLNQTVPDVELISTWCQDFEQSRSPGCARALLGECGASCPGAGRGPGPRKQVSPSQKKHCPPCQQRVSSLAFQQAGWHSRARLLGPAGVTCCAGVALGACLPLAWPGFALIFGLQI